MVGCRGASAELFAELQSSCGGASGQGPLWGLGKRGHLGTLNNMDMCVAEVIMTVLLHAPYTHRVSRCGSSSNCKPIMSRRIIEAPQSSGFGCLPHEPDFLLRYGPVDIGISDFLFL